MQEEKDTIRNSEDEAMEEMLKENMGASFEDMTCNDAIELMESENTRAEEQGYGNFMPSKKQVNRILTIIEKTELLMGEFFKRLAQVDRKFDNVAQIFFNNAAEIGASIKHPNDEEKRLIMINIASGVVVKGIGALWQSLQTERQLRDIIQVFAQEAEEKMPYVGMLIDWLDLAGDIAFERMLYSSDIDGLLINFDLYRGLDYNFKLACYLYSVYDSALKGEFTKLAYPTLYDVNRSLISNLANIKTKETEAEQQETNRAALSKISNRIRSVMTGETELPEVIDVLIASDDQLMATAINMGMPAPDSFEEEEGFEQSPHFPFEDLDMIPESIAYVSDFSSLKGCGNSHQIAEKIDSNDAVDSILEYVEEFKNNQKQYNSRETLYGINCWLLVGVTFMLFWDFWDWKWYWSLLMAIVMLILGFKFSPFSKIRQICRNKAILIERDLYRFTKDSAGYTEVIDFHELRRKNNNVFICAVICGILGCFAGPFGFIVGIAVGSIIGWIVKTYKSEEEDWRNLSIGSGLWAKIWCVILMVCLLLLIYNWLFGGIHSKKTQQSSDQTVEIVEANGSPSDLDEIVEAVAVSSEDDETALANEAIKDLYRIFYFKEETPDATISKELKRQFEDFGITSSVKEAYTPSFQAEINRMEAMSEKVLQAGGGLTGFDYDILFGGQESPVDLNMQVSDVENIDDNNVIIRVKYHNGEDYERQFKMKRINGTFKIDDMDDLRSFIEQECKDCQKWLDEEATSQVSSQTDIESLD